MSSINHYRQVIERAQRSSWGNRDAVIAECRQHIEQIEKRAAEFNEKWARMKQIRKGE